MTLRAMLHQDTLNQLDRAIALVKAQAKKEANDGAASFKHERQAVGAVVVGLCGLPGSGKSTLSQDLLKAARNVEGMEAKVVIVEYDAIEESLRRGDWPAEGSPDDIARLIVSQLVHTQFLIRHPTNMPAAACLAAQVGAAGGANVIGARPYNATVWRNSRMVARSVVRQLAIGVPPTSPDPNFNTSAKLLIICDDNLYYRSMRHELYKIAQSTGAGFAVISVECEVDECLARNATRLHPVPSWSVRRMASLFEQPSDLSSPWHPGGDAGGLEEVGGGRRRPAAAHHTWESSRVIRWNTRSSKERGRQQRRQDTPVASSAQSLLTRVLAVGSRPIPQPETRDIVASAEDAAATAKSVGHHADLRLRKLVKSSMGELSASNGGGGLDKKAVAAALNQCRQDVLRMVKEGEWSGGLDTLDELDAFFMQAVTNKLRTT